MSPKQEILDYFRAQAAKANKGKPVNAALMPYLLRLCSSWSMPTKLDHFTPELAGTLVKELVEEGSLVMLDNVGLPSFVPVEFLPKTK